MQLFSFVKASVTTREAAQFYGIQVDRSGMCRCIFHEDRSPSLWVKEGYYCHACQAHGSVIDFTAWLFDLTPMEAAQKLVIDFSLDVDRTPSPQAIQRQASFLLQKQERNDFSALTDMIFRQRDHIRKAMVSFAPTRAEDRWDRRWAAACLQCETVDRLLDLAVSTDADDRRLFVTEAQAWLRSTPSSP